MRGTAFQNIGPFIAVFKGQKDIDQRVIDFYCQTTENSNNKDVCFYASYNFPAFVYVLEKDCWARFKKIYLKLARFNDGRIKKTLSNSIHELAKILGPEITQEDLVPIMEKFLKDPINDIRIGALKNLHVFLEDLPLKTRKSFIKFIIQTYNDAQYDWRIKHTLAKNLSHYAKLFDEEMVHSEFVPMFFMFCDNQVAKVSETAALGLADILDKLKSDKEKREMII